MELITTKSKDDFLSAYEESNGNLYDACAAASISLPQYYKAVSHDKTFQREIVAIDQKAIDALGAWVMVTKNKFETAQSLKNQIENRQFFDMLEDDIQKNESIAGTN